MGEVIQFKPKKHVYHTESCSGCGEVLKNTFHEIGLHYEDHIKHIGLCGSCYEKALDENVF